MYYKMLIWLKKLENCKKVENYGLKKYKSFWKHIWIWKKVKKFGDIKIQKQKFSISIKSIDIGKIALLNKV